MKVKCIKCGSEYEMPPIATNVIMEDCPNCKNMKAVIPDDLKRFFS